MTRLKMKLFPATAGLLALGLMATAAHAVTPPAVVMNKSVPQPVVAPNRPVLTAAPIRPKALLPAGHYHLHFVNDNCPAGTPLASPDWDVDLTHTGDNVEFNMHVLNQPDISMRGTVINATLPSPQIDMEGDHGIGSLIALDFGGRIDPAANVAAGPADLRVCTASNNSEDTQYHSSGTTYTLTPS